MNDPSASVIFTSDTSDDDDGTLTIFLDRQRDLTTDKVTDWLVIHVKGTDRQKKKCYRFALQLSKEVIEDVIRKKDILDHWGYDDSEQLPVLQGVGDSEGDLEAVVCGDTMALYVCRHRSPRRQIAGPYTMDEARRMVGAIAAIGH